MCKTDEKTLFLYRATKCHAEVEKIGFAETHDELIIDFGPNTTVFHFLHYSG